MAFPTRSCVICEEEFELKPDHPGYANRCRECNSPQNSADTSASAGKTRKSADELKAEREANEARRAAIRDLLYTRK